MEMIYIAAAIMMGLGGMGAAIGVGILGRRSAMVIWVGAGVIALPQIWLASSLFSRFGAQVPALLGAVKFGLSALLFGAWFVTTSDPQPGALFLGAMVVLVSSPVFYHLAAKHEDK